MYNEDERNDEFTAETNNDSDSRDDSGVDEDLFLKTTRNIMILWMLIIR